VPTNEFKLLNNPFSNVFGGAIIPLPGHGGAVTDKAFPL
jgi:hypothetical protein